MGEYDVKYWYNLSTGQVEEDMQHGKKSDLLGPYPTREAAANAIKSTRARTEAWDEQERLREEADARFEGREPGEKGGFFS